MIAVGLDCSGDQLVLGVAKDGAIAGSWNIPARRRHSELLPGEILRRLELLDLSLKDIGGYTVVSGPGSYTGLRVGAATIMGLAGRGGVPVSAMTTSEFLRRLYGSDGRWLGCVIPCRGDMHYWCTYPPSGRAGSDIQVLTLEEIIVSLPSRCRIVAPGVAGMDEAILEKAVDVEVIVDLPEDAGGRLALWGTEKINRAEIIDWDNWQLTYGPMPGFRKWTRRT